MRKRDSRLKTERLETERLPRDSIIILEGVKIIKLEGVVVSDKV